MTEEKGKISNFLVKFDAANTKKLYKTAIKRFLHSKYDEGDPEDLADRYFQALKEEKEDAKSGDTYREVMNERKQVRLRIQQDLARFIDYLTEETSLRSDEPEISISTAKKYVSLVKSFILEMAYQEIFTERLDFKKEWEELRDRRRIFEVDETTKDIVLDRDQLKEILKNCDIFGRALFLTLLSSGMRVGAAVQTTKHDITFYDSGIAKIEVMEGYTKTGDPHTTFISEEVTEEVKRWLE